MDTRNQDWLALALTGNLPVETCRDPPPWGRMLDVCRRVRGRKDIVVLHMTEATWRSLRQSWGPFVETLPDGSRTLHLEHSLSLTVSLDDRVPDQTIVCTSLARPRSLAIRLVKP